MAKIGTDPSDPVAGEDWQAVADAINARMTQRRIGQQALATASGVSVATLRLLQHGMNGRRAQNATLIAVARALGWPDDHLIEVLVGATTAAATVSTGTAEQQILAALQRIERRLADLSDRLTPNRHRPGDPPTGTGHGNGPSPTGR